MDDLVGRLLSKEPGNTVSREECAAEISRLREEIARLNISTVDLAAMKKVLDELDTFRTANERLLEALMAIRDLPAHPMRKKGVAIAEAAIAQFGGKGAAPEKRS